MRLLILGMALLVAMQVIQATAPSAIIYKNEACGHCTPYLEKLMPLLISKGYDPQIKDFINSPDARKELAGIQNKFSVPLQYQGHMLVYLDEKYLLEGHLPVPVVHDLLDKNPDKTVILYQDSMGDAKTYSLINDGKAVECNIDTGVSDCSATKGNSEGNFFNHPWILPLLVFLLPVGFIVKYGF